MSQALGEGGAELGNTRETDRHGCYLHVVYHPEGKVGTFQTHT